MGKASRTKRERGATGGASRPEGGASDRPAAPGDRASGAAVSPAPPGGSPPAPWWEIPRSLAIVLLAAAVFRAVYFFLYSRQSVLFDGMMLDASVYDAWAKSIAAGEWIGKEAFYLPPLYPYALAVLYSLFGHSYALVYLLQELLGLANLVLVYRIGTAVFNERAGILAACGAALYGPFAFFETKLLSTTVGLALNLAALLILVRAEQDWARTGRISVRRWLVAGLAIGIASLCLPGTILLLIVYAGARAVSSARLAASMAAGAFVALLPVLLHNLAVAGDPLFLSGQGGITFYQGNNPSANGLYDVVPGFSGAPELQPAEEKAIAEREEGRPLRRSQVSAHFFGKGLRFIVSSPGRFIRLEFSKLGRLLGDYEASTEYSIYMEREQIPWLRIAFLPYAVIVGLGSVSLLGGPAWSALSAVAGARGRRPRAGGGSVALFLYTLYAAAIPLLFYVSSRYRLPLVPALLVYGGALADGVLGDLRKLGQPGPARTKALAVALGVALLSFFPLGSPSVTAEANVYYNIGNVFSDRGQQEEALKSFNRSLAEWPTNTYALINRGNSLNALGRLEEAVASYRKAEEVKPDFWKSYQSEGAVLQKLGRLEEEAEVYRRGLGAGGAQAHFLLATTLHSLNRLPEAEAEIRQAIRMKPEDPRFYNTLGGVLEGRLDMNGAIEAYKQANSADPRYAKSRFNLGLVYREKGELDPAAAMYEEGLKIEPRNARAHARLAEIYALKGDTARARDEYRTALAIDPKDSFALGGLAKLGKQGS